MPREIPSTTESKVENTDSGMAKSENLDLVRIQREAETTNNNDQINENRPPNSLAHQIAEISRTANQRNHRNLSSGFGRSIPTLQEMQEKGETLVADNTGRGLIRKLFTGGKERLLDRQKPDRRGKGERTEQKEIRTQKFEFPPNDSYGLIKELHIPQGFKDTGHGDDFQRVYANDRSKSLISYMNGTPIEDESKATLEELVSNHQGVLKAESQELLAAATIIGGGYHPFSNKPQISIDTLNGKKVIVLQDQNEELRLAGYTLFVPSNDNSSIYTISYAGSIDNLEAVKAGLKKTKWQDHK